MKVVFAASLGTVFELYDFFLVGLLASEIAKNFFSGVNPTAGFIFTLLGFAAGFLLRPFGAIVFGRIGDIVGRKYTFLVTIVLMGLSTFIIGLLPGYAAIGIAAPIIFVGMRMLQGLALGGEFGGAMVYVAEHAPNGQRGGWMAWIILTGALGFLLAMGVVIGLRTLIPAAQFADWGWRLPFLFSVLLLLISLWIRLKLDESPEFKRIKEEGKLSKAPISESFGEWKNLRLILIALFGIVPGQAVVWYTGQFYTLFFLTKVLKVDGTTTNALIVLATILTAPLYIFFGKLSDKIGRKPVYLGGLVLAATLFFPLFQALTHYANPAMEKALHDAPILVQANPTECSFQFNPIGTSKFTTSCDIVKGALARYGLDYQNKALPAGAVANVTIGRDMVEGYSASDPASVQKAKQFDDALRDALKKNGHEIGAVDPASINKPMALLILMVLLTFGTMTFAPTSAMLVELFPSRIRYTAMSFPYHLGVAWFGGFLPAITFAIVAATGDIYSGLLYPIVIAAASFVIVLIFARETKGVDIFVK
ncbi:MAG: MFS transporter [Erythrobacter sp.]